MRENPRLSPQLLKINIAHDFYSSPTIKNRKKSTKISVALGGYNFHIGFAPIFPDICYHLTHYKPAAADIPVASDNPAHYADAIRYNARTPLQGSLLPLTRLVWA